MSKIWQEILTKTLNDYYEGDVSERWKASNTLEAMAKKADEAESKKPNCTFVSDWGGIMLRTPCYLNRETGEFESQSLELEGLECLEREWIEFEDEEIELCPNCYGFILKTVMVPNSVGKTLEEAKECPNPDCENKA